jgi:hypothetical protein
MACRSVYEDIEMPRAVLALLLLIALPVWAQEPKDLTWSEMIPPDAAAEVPNMTPLHDMSKMADALSAESAPAAKQDMPNAPVVKASTGRTFACRVTSCRWKSAKKVAPRTSAGAVFRRLHPCAATAVEPDRACQKRSRV